MRDNHDLGTMKEIQHAVVDSEVLGAKFIDVIAEIVRMGSAQFVSKILQPTQPLKTYVASLWDKPIKPFHERHCSIRSPKED